MKKYAAILMMFLLLIGCTSARISRNLTSGAIGCPQDEIEILNETATYNSLHNWEAICRGQHFICSYHPTTGVNCKKPLVERQPEDE